MPFAAFLIPILTFFASSVIRTALIGAGLGLFTAAISGSVLKNYIAQAQVKMGAMGTISGLMGVSGIDVCISILIGALVCRASMEGMKLAIGHIKK